MSSVEQLVAALVILVVLGTAGIVAVVTARSRRRRRLDVPLSPAARAALVAGLESARRGEIAPLERASKK